MMEKWKQFFEQKQWRQLKKTDWLAIALLGVLLLVVTMPVNQGEVKNSAGITNGAAQEKETADSSEKEDYTEYLEHKLEQALGQMEGVGKVSVMITMSDQGENVLEKDKTERTSTVTETDSSGSMQLSTEVEYEETTIYEENGGERLPYVSKEILPKIEGVLIVAEGGGNSKTASDISDAVKALFSVEAHRIKVVKMG